jgi:cell division protein FtsL
MARKLAGDLEELVGNTEESPSARAAQPTREARYIYGGDTHSAAAGYAMRPNKKATRRRISTFNIIVLLFGAGIAVILYISNIIAINQLAVEVNQLRSKCDKIQNTNAALRAEINRKSGRERIGMIATEQLGLKYPKEQPTWFEVDEHKLEELGIR